MRIDRHRFFGSSVLKEKKDDPASFKVCLNGIQNGMDFQAAFQKGFGAGAMTKWRAFKGQITG